MNPESLRRFPRFRFETEDQLRALAETARTLRLPARRRVRPTELPPALCLYLIRGEVRRSDRRGRVQSVNHRARCAQDPILDARFPQLITTTRVKLLRLGEANSDRQPLPLASPQVAEPGDAAFDEWLARLVDGPLLGGLDVTTLERLFRGLAPLPVARGERVIRQGEVADAFYVVREGAVGIVRDGRTVYTVRSGGFFGEDALLGRRVRNADAMAIESSVVLALPADLFSELLAERPSIGSRFAGFLARHRADDAR